MAVTNLALTTGTGLNITSENTIATYTTAASGWVSGQVYLSNLNGAAATLTLKVVILDASDNQLGVPVSYSMAKDAAANTTSVRAWGPIRVRSGEKVRTRIVSTNASDTNVSWANVVDDAVAADVLHIAGNAVTASGTVNFTAGNTIASGTGSHMANLSGGAVLVQSGTASGQLNVTGGVVQADLAKWLGVEPESLNNGFVGVNVQEIFGVPIAVTGTVNSIAFASGETVAYVGSEVIANVSKIQGETINMGGNPGDGLLMTAGQTIGSSTLTAGQVRTELATELARIDVATSTRLAAASYTAAPTAAANADAVWDEARSGHTTNGTYGAVSEWATSSGLTAQQVRDAMALTTTANAASGSIDNKLDGIKAKTDLISSGGDVVTVRRTSGYIEIVQSTANLNATGTEFTFTKASTDTGWPSDLLSNGSYAVSLALIPTNGGSVTTVSGGVVVSATSVRVDVSAATASALTAATSAGPNYQYQVWASTSTTNVYCLDSGNCRVIDDIRS
jgi:hypothetical protein